MKRTMNDVHGETCAVAATAEIVATKWTPLIVHDLSEGARRFKEIEHACPGISPRTLSERLDMLERKGTIVRRSYPESPPRVEYELTDKGRALLPDHPRDAQVRPRVARPRAPSPRRRRASLVEGRCPGGSRSSVRDGSASRCLRGILSSGWRGPDEIVVTRRRAERRAELRERFGDRRHRRQRRRGPRRRARSARRQAAGHRRLCSGRSRLVGRRGRPCFRWQRVVTTRDRRASSAGRRARRARDAQRSRARARGHRRDLRRRPRARRGPRGGDLGARPSRGRRARRRGRHGRGHCAPAPVPRTSRSSPRR